MAVTVAIGGKKDGGQIVEQGSAAEPIRDDLAQGWFSRSLLRLEAVMDAFVLGEGGFAEQPITPDRNETWMRVIVAGLPVAFGVYACTVIRRRGLAQEGRCG